MLSTLDTKRNLSRSWLFWSMQRSSNKGCGAGMSLAGSQEQQLQRKASAAPGSELGRVQARLSLEKAAGSTHIGHRGCLSPGCCSRTPQTGCLNNRHLLLTVLEAVKSKIKVLADSVLSEGPLPGFQTAAFSLCAHRAIPGCMHVELTNLGCERE